MLRLLLLRPASLPAPATAAAAFVAAASKAAPGSPWHAHQISMAAAPASQHEQQQQQQSKQQHEQQQQQQQQEHGAGAQQQHIGLDDPSLRMVLRYNTSFKTDEERLYHVGMVAAMDRKARMELRKALAAHRLALRDAALQAGPSAARGAAPPPSPPPPGLLAERMAARLAEMEGAARRAEGAL